MRASGQSNKFTKALDGLISAEINDCLSQLGADVAEDDTPDFGQALRQSLQSGTIDITNWQNHAIRCLVMVASEKDIQINLRRGDRTISPLSFPRSNEFLDYFVEEYIMSEPW